MKTLNYKILPELPEPYAITDIQIKSVYRSLYEKLLELYNNNDIYQIDCLLDYNHKKSLIPTMLYTTLKSDSPSNQFLSDFATLLYKIATIYPVKHFKAQISAALFFLIFLNGIKNILLLHLIGNLFTK